MELRRLGNTEIMISPVLMGTWQAGKRMWVGIDDQQSIQAIRAALDVGISTIDTAEVYGEGHSERIVAEAIAGRRQEVVLATKVFANHLHYAQVIEACDRSLKNLQTDTIDLYQIHWPAGTWNSDLVPIAETMAALNHLKSAGKIRAIGVSNFTQAQLAEALEHGRIDSLQPPYSLFWRQVESELQPFCVAHNITILAYSPLAQGLLTGRFRHGHLFPEGDHRAKHKLMQPDHYTRVQKALTQLEPIAARNGTTLGTLALAWLLSRPQTCAIVGARAADQVWENAKAMDLHLTPEDLTAMDTIGRGVTDFLDEHPVQWNF
ncbi:MAG: aldo/keto reductase [Oscillatoriales cyanobacterium SM2_2_1]|nr:aldo/keto reductase [Oscillatoriales cyanobacterium SM2_2_1]